MHSRPDPYWPARSLPSSTGITLLEISAQAGMSGSDPIALSIVHLTASKWRVVPGPTFAISLTRGSVKDELRIGEAPPPRIDERAMTSFEQTHCMKIQAASGVCEYRDRAIADPPRWPIRGISPKPAFSGERSFFSFGGGAASIRPATFELFPSNPGKNSPQEISIPAWPCATDWLSPSQVQVVAAGGMCLTSSCM